MHRRILVPIRRHDHGQSVPLLLCDMPVQWCVQLGLLVVPSWGHLLEPRVGVALDEAAGEVLAMAWSDLRRGRRRQRQVRVMVALLARLPFLLSQLDERVAIGLVEVDVAALFGEDVRVLEELVQVVCLRLAWSLLHDHLRLLILKERSYGHIGVLYLILNVSEALISQLRGQA